MLTSITTEPGRILLTISSVTTIGVRPVCELSAPTATSQVLSCFSRTASQAISNVLMPLLLHAGEEGGIENLAWHQVHLRSGIYLFKGALTNFYLSERFDLKYTDLNLLIASQR